LLEFVLNENFSALPVSLQLPPGPKQKPIIRNLLDLPTENQWITVAEWSKKYGTRLLYRGTFPLALTICQGDVIYLNVIGQNMIFLNSIDIALDLFEKRSSLYSDRILSSMIEM
jgi:hypothetical protein